MKLGIEWFEFVGVERGLINQLVIPCNPFIVTYFKLIMCLQFKMQPYEP